MSVPATPAPDQAPPSRGLAVRLMAVVLILVGTFDMMLSWRGSLQVDGFYIVLFALGIVLYGVGSVLASRGSGNAPTHPGSTDLN